MNQINKIRNEKGEATTGMEIHSIITDYYKKLYANKMDSLEDMDKFLERHSLLRLNWKNKSINIPIISTEIEFVI